MELLKKYNKALFFPLKFLGLFLLFYYFNIFFFSITSPASLHIAPIAQHLNYIRGLRFLLLQIASFLLNCLGYVSIFNQYQLLVTGHQILNIVYSCLGLGLMSFFAAFVITYPKKTKPKLVFLFCGLLGIQTFNIIRLMLLAIYWDSRKAKMIDHHILFNIFIYLIITLSLYFWVNNRKTDPDANN